MDDRWQLDSNVDDSVGELYGLRYSVEHWRDRKENAGGKTRKQKLEKVNNKEKQSKRIS